MSAIAVTAAPVKVSTRSTRDKVLLVVMLVVVLAGAFYLLAWKPQSSELSKARDERANAETELAVASAVASEGAGDAAASSAEVAVDAQILIGVPADPATAELLRQIDGLAAQTGVGLGSISLSQPAALGGGQAATPTDATASASLTGPVSLTVALDVKGDPAATAAFLAGVKSLPRLAVVDQLTVQNTPADEATGTPASQQLQLSLRVFATGA